MQNSSAVEHLQRENRRWKLLALALAIGFVVLLFAGFDYPQPNLVRARNGLSTVDLLQRARQRDLVTAVEAGGKTRAISKAKGPLVQALLATW